METKGKCTKGKVCGGWVVGGGFPSDGGDMLFNRTIPRIAGSPVWAFCFSYLYARFRPKIQFILIYLIITRLFCLVIRTPCIVGIAGVHGGVIISGKLIAPAPGRTVCFYARLRFF